MDFTSDSVLTIALCLLVPFTLCFIWPVIAAALCQNRDAHVEKIKGFYEFKPSVDGFVETNEEVDEVLGGPTKERLVFEKIGDEGFDDEEVLSGVGVGYVEKEEGFDGFGGDLCECVVKVFDGGLGEDVSFGERNVEEEEEGIVDGGVEDLIEESCVRDEFGLGRSEVGVCLMEEDVEEDGFDGGVAVCGYVGYLNDEGFERDENGGDQFDLGKDRVGDVSWNEMSVEEERLEGDAGVCESRESLVDESSEKRESGEVETRNEVGVGFLPEKNVEEECSACEVVICDSKEDLTDNCSEEAPESEEIKVSKCVRKDESDEASDNVVDGEANEEELFSEDNDWEDIERTELERLFGAAVVFVGSKSNADRVSSIGNDVKMRLNGLLKIATQGPCLEPQPMAFKVSARAKW